MLALAHKALIAVVTWLPMISVIVMIHELGHFSVARAFGVSIDRFSLGFGKAIAAWRDKHGTEWRIGWIPLGGYVRFGGDENAASVPDRDDLAALRRQIIEREGPGGERKYFAFKPLWQRALVVVAGPVANFILAIVLFSIVSLAFGDVLFPPKVSMVVPASAADQAGFKAGDVVLKADSTSIDSFNDLNSYVVLRAGTPISFLVQRGAQRLTLMATPRETYVDQYHSKIGRLGVAGAPGRRVKLNPLQALGSGVRQTWDIVDLTGTYLGRLVTGHASADMLSGPLGTLQLSGTVATEAANSATALPEQALAVLVSLSQLAGMISVSLGFMNLLPVPVLDGGHLLFYVVEAITRRPLAASIQMASYRVGLALLLGLMLFATTNDLLRINAFHFLGGLFS